MVLVGGGLQPVKCCIYFNLFLFIFIYFYISAYSAGILSSGAGGLPKAVIGQTVMPGLCCPTELLFYSLGRFLLESRLMYDPQDSRWVVLAARR